MGATESYADMLEALQLTQYVDVQTAERHVRAIREMVAGASVDPGEHLEVRFPAVQRRPSLTLVANIPFTSLCAHHMLPFWGVAHVGFVQGPNRELVGLSKIGRCLQGYAARPQTQEQIMQNMVDALDKRLGVSGSGIRIRATHSCMALRGLKGGEHTSMVTEQFCGIMQAGAWRESFMQGLLDTM